MEKQQTPLRSRLTLSVFLLFIGGFFLLNRLIPAPETLESERRKPAPWPELSVKTLMSGEFMDGFAKFAADTFTFRDGLRTVRAAAVFDIFMQADKSGVYLDKAVGAGKFEKIDETSVRRAAEKINRMAAKLPGLDIYCAAVPDKSIYAQHNYPGYDAGLARYILTETLDSRIRFIDLTDRLSSDDTAAPLSAGDFYKTDLHWDQSKLQGVLNKLGTAMGALPLTGQSFTEHSAGEFYGAYKGQLALPVKPDKLTYLTSDGIDGAAVKYLNADTLQWDDGPVYDLGAAGGRDPYDLFLRGVQPLIVIGNPSAKTGRQLYLFRDSFSSSLAPLLLSAYEKVTLIDLRYIDSRALPMVMEFAETDADVLFLYSSQILNNESVLLVE